MVGADIHVEVVFTWDFGFLCCQGCLHPDNVAGFVDFSLKYPRPRKMHLCTEKEGPALQPDSLQFLDWGRKVLLPPKRFLRILFKESAKGMTARKQHLSQSLLWMFDPQTNT